MFISLIFFTKLVFTKSMNFIYLKYKFTTANKTASVANRLEIDTESADDPTNETVLQLLELQ